MAGSKSRRGGSETLLFSGCVRLALVWAALLPTGLSCSRTPTGQSGERPWKELPVDADIVRVTTSGQFLTALCEDDQL